MISITCFNPQQAHAALMHQVWPEVKNRTMSGERVVVEVKQEKRSSAQNRVLWARLTDISEQVEWYGKKLTQTDWKHVFSASMTKLDVVPNLDGTGFVALGLSTSSMTKSELGDLNTLIMAFGSQRTPPVRWSVASLCGEPE